MKVVILAGGRGSRLAEETDVRPKPMVEVGGRPLLWHIMRTFAHFGHREFVVALGYKGEEIKRYFLDYHLLNSDLRVDLKHGRTEPIHDGAVEDWVIELVDTGLKTETGGRIKRLAPRLSGGEPFLVTYGDGVSNVDISQLLRFHNQHGRLATVTAVRPPARFGGLKFRGDTVEEFIEKPQIGEGWINGGFFVFKPEVLEYLKGDDTILEREPLERLARDGQLAAYRHEGFWQCVDTRRDLHFLEELWRNGAPWKAWS